jgi:phage portal protein BeeE
LADGKAQTMEESQRRVSAEADTADKFGSLSIVYSLLVLIPSATGATALRLIRAAAERHKRADHSRTDPLHNRPENPLVT